MSPFVVFCVDFGHFYSRHFHHKKEVSRHFLALSRFLTFYVAKCNLGKVNLEAMLSSNRWMQEARLQPWRLAGALCDAYTQLAATAGRL